MIAGKSTIAAGATMLTVGAIGGVGINAATNSDKATTVAEKPIIQTDIQTVHRTIHIKPKTVSASRTARGVALATGGSGSGTAYTASSPSQAVSSSRSQSGAGSAPTVSTHSSGGASGGYSGDDHGVEDSHENEHHNDNQGTETEGSDD